MDDNGNLTICGIFKTGEDGEARTVIDGNGIQSYNDKNQLHGLVSNPDNKHADFALYYNGSEYFKIYNPIGGATLFCNGNAILRMNGSGANFVHGANGSYVTADGKTVTVTGGIITDIQ